ncbi:Major facilitator super domain-containing protein 7 [Gonapodya sp. JEL0774]|nr:Major facilitator super domain-containing protein 7 [Gonapodya sp. JEL0774]
MIQTIIAGAFTSWLIDNQGLRKSFIFGAAFNFAGSLLRYLGTFASSRHTALIIALIGQTILAAGRSVGTTASTKVAQVWFGTDERTIANLVGTSAPSLGVAFANAVTPYILTEPDDVPKILLSWTAVALLVLALSFFYQNAPPTPPTPSAAIMKTRDAVKIDYVKSLRTAATNKSYLLLLLIMGPQIALFFIFITLVSQIMIPAGLSPKQVGFIGTSIIIGGWCTSPFIAKYVDRKKNHVTVLRALLVGTTVSFVGLTLCVQYRVAYPLILFMAVMLGVWNFQTLPLVFELAMEVTFPHLLPAMSNWLIFVVGQAISIVGTLTLQNVGETIVVMWAIGGMSGVTTVIGFALKDTGRRLKVETMVLEQQAEARLKEQEKVEV